MKCNKEGNCSNGNIKTDEEIDEYAKNVFLNFLFNVQEYDRNEYGSNPIKAFSAVNGYL